MYRAGATTAGWYHLDTTSNRNNADREEVYCEDGWTFILIRNPRELQYADVSLILPVTTMSHERGVKAKIGETLCLTIEILLRSTITTGTGLGTRKDSGTERNHG